jgi:putative nicotinate phosphoribosyltransferase
VSCSGNAGLLTDRYELSMVSSLLRDGRADTPAVFEAFARRLPRGRRYGVVAGLGRIVEAIMGLSFSQAEVAFLQDAGVVDEATAAWLRDFSFTGSIDAYAEGDLYFPYSPVLTVRAPLAQGLLVETLVLSILNHDSAVASAAARMVDAAAGRPVLEMGSRRTHEEAAVAAARAAWIAGFAGTSNLAAGFRFGVPTVGTAAHAFTLAHESEEQAFTAQVAAHGAGTTLLVDTFDVPAGIDTAVRVAGPGLGAIRIDSGDLARGARAAREQLDGLGATGTRIVVTSDLDEFSITALADAPVDVFGAGTSVVTGSGHPTASMVYKLVAIGDGPSGAMRPVEKKAAGKGSRGGRKVAYRTLDSAGFMVGEHVVVRQVDDVSEAFPGRRLNIPVVVNGVVVHSPSLEESRRFAAAARGELRPVDRLCVAAPAAFEVSA